VLQNNESDETKLGISGGALLSLSSKESSSIDAFGLVTTHMEKDERDVVQWSGESQILQFGQVNCSSLGILLFEVKRMACIAGPDAITSQRTQDLLSGRAVITSNIMNGQIRQASEELRVPVQEIATCEHQNSFEQHMIVTAVHFPS